MGIEPTLFAWEARVLPLNDTRRQVKVYIVITTLDCFYPTNQHTYGAIALLSVTKKRLGRFSQMSKVKFFFARVIAT
jgi:hypothetical protein